MQPQHTILITAAGGHIGTQLVELLLTEPVKLVLATSNAERLQSQLPSNPKQATIAVEQGSVKDPVWLQSIMTAHAVDSVFLCLIGTDEIMTTLNFFDAMSRVDTVKHVVYVSLTGDITSEKGLDLLSKTHSAMHIVIKPILEMKLTRAYPQWTSTILGPSLFWDNDLRSKKYLLEQGFFDEPLTDKGVSRVSPTDIATVARNSLIDQQKWAGKKIMIGSKKKYRGSEIAALWGKALGKEVRMCGFEEESLAAFEKRTVDTRNFKEEEGPAWGRDLRLMYEGFNVDGWGMTDEEYELQVQCLGREPLDYEKFVQDTGKSWVS